MEGNLLVHQIKIMREDPKRESMKRREENLFCHHVLWIFFICEMSLLEGF